MGLPRKEFTDEDLKLLQEYNSTVKSERYGNPIYKSLMENKKPEVPFYNDPVVQGKVVYNPYAGQYPVIVPIVAQEIGVDPYLLAAMAQAESGFDHSSKSRVGAIGMMQLMPNTAKSLKVDPYNLRDNIKGGALYLKNLSDMFDGNHASIIAAYNAGPYAVKDFLNGTNKTGKNPNRLKTENGIPVFKETQNHVVKVMGYYNKLKSGK
jgi:soluble lytic murein transglycosylase-like protein